mgnify:CR=1 FL=1
MKKFLITSACTLLLSLFGTLGANQNAFNIKDDLSKGLNTEKMEQQAEDTVEEKVTKNDTKKAKKASKDNKDTKMVENNTVDPIDATQEAPTEQLAETPKNTRETAKEETTTNSVDPSTNKTSTPATNNNKTNYIKPANNSTSKETVINSDTINKIVYDKQRNCYTLNGKVIAYGNTDLSEFGSIQDILSELKNKGFNVEMPSTNSNGYNDDRQQDKPIENKTLDNSTTKPTPAPVEEKPSNSGTSNYANQVLQLVNNERAKAGLSALTMDSKLTAAANKRAVESAQSFSHTRPNGTKFSTVLGEYNISYRTSGENLAYGQRTPQEVVTGWMNSPGHRANILNSNFNKIGIGVYQSSNGTIYWTQLFTN